MHSQGDILLIPLPFTNLKSEKKRPVLVISSDRYNCTTDDIIVLAITSNISGKNTEITITQKNMDEGKLKVDSCIRVDKIYTLSQSIVVKKFGKVNSQVLTDVKNKFFEIIS